MKMGDTFTQILLITLIGLFGGISKIFYSKLEDVLKRIEKILLSDLDQKKDIQYNKKAIEDHEERLENHEHRINHLEKR